MRLKLSLLVYPLMWVWFWWIGETQWLIALLGVGFIWTIEHHRELELGETQIGPPSGHGEHLPKPEILDRKQ